MQNDSVHRRKTIAAYGFFFLHPPPPNVGIVIRVTPVFSSYRRRHYLSVHAIDETRSR